MNGMWGNQPFAKYMTKRFKQIECSNFLGLLVDPRVFLLAVRVGISMTNLATSVERYETEFDTA